MNFNLFAEALNYVNKHEPMHEILTARIVGEELIVFSTTAIADSMRKKISDALGEKVTAFKIDSAGYWDNVQDTVRRQNFKKPLIQQCSPRGKKN